MTKTLTTALLLAFAAAAASSADDTAAPKSADTPLSPAKAAAWSYSPLKAPAVPAVKDARWVRSPLDAFVLAKLEAKGLKPSPEADRATYIRRVTLDLWGLIPSPEEVAAFVTDKSPQAYEKLVDRLLASPHYGERQARRWLDLTRYADSDGYNADGTRPNAWRYRDYVVNAFNKDKPYNQFVREQIAGDELWPDSQEALIATGFLRNFPDEINARDLNLKKQEVANDLTDTVGAVFLGTTFNCAQCHDHKFDKLSQKEYYQFQAFFVNASWRDDIKAATGKELDAYTAAYARWDAATRSIRDQQDALLKPIIEKLESDRLSGFVPETRTSITKPEAERNAYDRWIYHRNLWTMSGRTRNAVNQLKTKDKEGYAKYQALEKELRKFDDIKPQDPGNISTMTELGHADAPPTYVLFKGIYDRKLEQVEPGFPALLTTAKPKIVPTATSSGRRTAVADWIVDPANPLPARVFVNRQWSQIFGNGIVETVSDFGKMGGKPTHPELVDDLATRFIQQGWSVKKLQREIVLSATYRQASSKAPAPETQTIDPQNRLLWAFPRQRLEAEQVRDSLLAAAGLLEDKVGGPPVFPPIPNNLDNRNTWVTSENPHDHHRRSLYVFVRRNTPYPLLDTFDWANPQIVHSKREVTTTAPQALALINSDLVFSWSKSLAARVIAEAGPSESARIDRAYQILYARLPDSFEKKTLLSFLDQQTAITRQQLAAGKTVNTPEGFGVAPAVNQQIDQLFKVAYGRQADRYERANFVKYIEQQKDKANRSGGSVAVLPGDDEDSAATRAAGQRITDPAKLTETARASAFVDLVHALANANDFLYRF